MDQQFINRINKAAHTAKESSEVLRGLLDDLQSIEKSLTDQVSSDPQLKKFIDRANVARKNGDMGEVNKILVELKGLQVK